MLLLNTKYKHGTHAEAV